jgi:LysM repeat protein
MAGYYKVKQGDYLSKIAKKHGFPDYTVIWNDPHNTQLKQQRDNPNVLYPGDKVYIPDVQLRQESGATDQRHSFVTNNGKLMLRLVLVDAFENPIANAQCALTVDGSVSQPTTDGSGKLEVEIPQDAKSGTLLIRNGSTAFENVPIPIQIGALDPVDQVSGQIARLNNLGYFAGPVSAKPAKHQSKASSGTASNTSDCGCSDGANSADGSAGGSASGSNGSNSSGQTNQQFLSAVQEFQCDQGLTVDGICGPQTQAKLKQVHGC